VQKPRDTPYIIEKSRYAHAARSR